MSGRDVVELRDEVLALRAEVARLKALINTPQTAAFLDAVRIEAAHQREIGRDEWDATKSPADWLWALGWLAGKAVHAEGEKRLHHIITSAALLANWHRRETTNSEPVQREEATASKKVGARRVEIERFVALALDRFGFRYDPDVASHRKAMDECVEAFRSENPRSAA